MVAKVKIFKKHQAIIKNSGKNTEIKKILIQYALSKTGGEEALIIAV